jgi:signal transduction histidine kinase
MTTEVIFLSGLEGVGFVLSLFFAYYCVYRRERRGAMALATLFVGISIWISADIIQSFTPAQSLPGIGVPLRFLGPDVTVIGLLLFAITYTGRSAYLSRRLFALLAVKPIITLAIVFSPYRDALVRTAAEAGSVVGYDFVLTPLFTVHVLYSWLGTIISLGLITLMMIQTRYGYQRQIIAVFIAVLSPFIFNVGAHTGLFPYNLTSTGFLITATFLTGAAFRLRLMDAVPVAQQTVLEEMRDMVFVTDENRTVLFANSAAAGAFNHEKALTGQYLGDVFGREQLDDISIGARQEIRATVAGEIRHLDVDSSRILDYRDNTLAEVLVCRDITEQKEREETLRQREDDLELLKDLQSRFLRHNLRNELNVVRANTELLADLENEQERDRYQTVIDKTDRILDWSKKAQTIEQIVGEGSMKSYAIDTHLTRLVGTLDAAYPNVAFEQDLAGESKIRAVPQVEYALENVIDNAARYNKPPDPTVRVSTTQTDQRVIVHIEDNGPGISETEIATLEEGAEGPLRHSSGFGLWLVYWVVLKSGGELSIDADDGTTVTLEFERVTEQTGGTTPSQTRQSQKVDSQ